MIVDPDGVQDAQGVVGTLYGVDSAPRCGWRPVRSIGDHVMLGPRGLLAAVLLRALDDVREGNGYSQRASVWIDSDREDGPCAFRRVCEALDLDAVKVRATIR